MRRAMQDAAKVGGRSGARLRIATAAVVLLGGVALAAMAAPQHDAPVAVSEDGGVYTVAATFTVPQAPSFALAALTDYGQIPRFMPAVRTSTVLERSDSRAVVEQEAVATFMMFSKRIHLVLDIEEAHRIIRFRDRCGTSFASYEGRWTVVEKDGSTLITYELSANPLFEVPAFVLKRLLTRDATHMIERLKVEISARSRQSLN